MDDALPVDWRREDRRTYTPADAADEREYVTYRHESGDVRLRVAPASLDGDDHPGYALTVTLYPGFEFGESFPVRRVLTFRRCDEVARSFMTLFAAAYEGPTTIEEALTYAHERTQEPDANDATVVLGDERAVGDHEE